MFESHYDCPREIRTVHTNFVSSVCRQKDLRWLAVLPYYDRPNEVSIVVSSRIADLIMSNWKQQIPVYLEFLAGFREGLTIESYHYSLRVHRLVHDFGSLNQSSSPSRLARYPQPRFAGRSASS